MSAKYCKPVSYIITCALSGRLATERTEFVFGQDKLCPRPS